MEEEKCPRCGEEFDPADDEVLVCPTCGREGCTARCIPAGRGTECLECEEDEG